MKQEEKNEWNELLRRCEASGNDGADVYEATEFANMIEAKYGRRISELMKEPVTTNTPTGKLELRGLFWAVEAPKSSEKRTPPEPVWLAPDYLPGLAEALAFKVPLMNTADLAEAQAMRDQLVCDIETYPNYFLCAFTSMRTGKSFFIEFTDSINNEGHAWLDWALHNFQIITFNGINFDVPILALALAGKTCGEIQHAVNMLIYQEIKPWIMLKSFKVDELKIDHIDLIEVCPLSGSLKIYGGRIHVPRMQDLPFPPEVMLSPEQIAIIRHYCINDLTTTAFINAALFDQLAIRKEMSAKYGVDLRSKSDAQVAEAVIKAELERMNGFKPRRPEIPPGAVYMYHVPPFIEFKTPVLMQALETVRRARFIVDDGGKLEMPEELKTLLINIGKCSYQMGIGGLHSTEEKISHRADDQFKIVDRDVTSFYPMIILNQRLHPLHLGHDFIAIYRSIVERRIAAKHSGNKIEAEMLKIVINGSFGKFGDQWSTLYSPDLLIQTTITGQLSLLMLIEGLELAGVQVLSANTDGVVMKFPRIMEDVVSRVVAAWEAQTSFTTEETEYTGLFCRDVNNYVAIKPGGKVKLKGAYGNPWNDPGASLDRFKKNPTGTICVEAAIAYLTDGTPIQTTIRGCRDLRKFIHVRAVKGGAVKDGVFLGKAIRWYYAANCGGEIIYAKTGNKVALSDGAKPCMTLPETFPDDVDFLRYEGEAVEILRDIAAI